ncbi:hypothetical protein IV203_025712 [Nitzschia inconspicua]|uniref:Uncharacterized protein n=1 Tax=Nitzschia inconspicua TaxID=303405 RepID=A0A9K3LJQ9_9STRA|nr:hypothetical protein IV203_025712 [Nitzschia inconspicua]
MASTSMAASLSRYMSRLTLSASASSRLMSSSRSNYNNYNNHIVINPSTILQKSSLSVALTSLTTTSSYIQFATIRSMATNRKVIDAKNAKRLKIQQKKKKKNNNTNKAAATSTTTTTTESPNKDGSSVVSSSQPFLQHQEWVKFQQSISVSGFQTGQVTTATVLKKSRGGKQARRKREKELTRLQGISPAMSGAGAFQAAGGGSSTSAAATKFPAIRYSPEETENLLRLAYETIPERAGKRGNRNLRRQERRWKLVRKIRSDYKANIVRAHERRMEHRHYKRQRVVQAKEDAAVQREKDLQYQAKVLQRWYRMQNPVTDQQQPAGGMNANA